MFKVGVMKFRHTTKKHQAALSIIVPSAMIQLIAVYIFLLTSETYYSISASNSCTYRIGYQDNQSVRRKAVGMLRLCVNLADTKNPARANRGGESWLGRIIESINERDTSTPPTIVIRQ